MRLILIIVLFLMGSGYTLLTGWYPEISWIQEPAFHLILPSAVVGLAILTALCGRLILRGDPELVAWTAVGLTGCILLVPLLVAKNQQAHLDRIADREVAENRENLRLALVRQREALRAAEEDRRERGKSDRFVQYEGRLPAATLDALRAIDKDMQEAVSQRADAYMAALEAYPTKGPTAWMRFRTIDELQAELDAHTYLYAETRTFTTFIQAFEEQYTAAIKELNLQPPADRVAIAELERILQLWDRTQLYTLRELDVRILGSAIKALTVLRDAWGAWRYNPRDNQLLFDNPDQEFSFYEAVQEMQAIAKELEALEAPENPVAPE